MAVMRPSARGRVDVSSPWLAGCAATQVAVSEAPPSDSFWVADERTRTREAALLRTGRDTATWNLKSRALGIARQDGAYYAMVMQTISLKLPDDLLAQLESEAKARRVTKSWLVRESLEKALRQQAPGGAVSCYDLARDLAGTVKGLPEDLADNPRHMEGFGK